MSYALLINAFGLLQNFNIRTFQLLLDMFRCLIVSKRLLSKVFLSTKGVYYEAHLGMNVKIVWIEPYAGTSVLPVDVDYKMLLTFAHFHQSLLKFALAKLYSLSELNFPPALVDQALLADTNADIVKSSEQGEGESETNGNENSEDLVVQQRATYGRFLVEEIEKNEGDGPQDAEIDAEFQKDETIQRMMDWNKDCNTKLFENYVFFLSREVRREIFEFVARSFGAKVIYHSENFESDAFKSSCVTHVITDRKLEHIPRDSVSQATREYVQPQWILDSVNFGALLDLKDYVPGQRLPPHLSPFEGKKREGFLSEREREVMKQLGRVAEDDNEEEYSEMSGDEDGLLEEEQVQNEEENRKARAEADKPNAEQDEIEESENESDLEEENEAEGAGIDDGTAGIKDSGMIPEQVFSKKLKRNRLNVKKQAKYEVKQETEQGLSSKARRDRKMKRKIKKDQDRLAASQLSRKKRRIYDKLSKAKQDEKKEVQVLRARQKALKKRRGLKK